MMMKRSEFKNTPSPAAELHLLVESTLDNVRFIGNVEFRQIMQVFNGLTAENKSLDHTVLYAGHLERLKTVFGTQQAIRLEILHGDFEWSPGNHLIGYGYFHDSAKTASATGFTDNSNRIVGLRADGAWPLAQDWKLVYTAEYAKKTIMPAETRASTRVIVAPALGWTRETVCQARLRSAGQQRRPLCVPDPVGHQPFVPGLGAPVPQHAGARHPGSLRDGRGRDGECKMERGNPPIPIRCRQHSFRQGSRFWRELSISQGPYRKTGDRQFSRGRCVGSGGCAQARHRQGVADADLQLRIARRVRVSYDSRP